MLLPSNFLITLLLLAFTVVSWGSWANTQKLTGKWRFELYYFDFAIGIGLSTLILAMTFGTLGYDGFSTVDDFLKAGKRQDLFGFCAGVLFNLGVMLLSAAISVIGFWTAFPICFGLAAIAGFAVHYFQEPTTASVLLLPGVMLVLAATVAAVWAYRSLALRQMETAARQGATRTTLKRVSMKGIVLGVAGGVAMGLLFPVSQTAAYRDPGNEAGLGPYALALIIALGMVGSTFVYSLFFMNLPVEGKPILITEYFKGTPRQHGLGLLGGVLFGCGLVADLVAASAQAEARVGPWSSYCAAMFAGIAGAAWGYFYWNEANAADSRTRIIFTASLCAMAVGLGLMSFGPPPTP